MKSETQSQKAFDLSFISRQRGVLMGIATLLIVLYHSYFSIPSVASLGTVSAGIALLLNTIHAHSDVGVELFLLLSGIGLYRSFRQDSHILRFYQKRAVRILPPFLIVSILWTAIQKTNGFGAFWMRALTLDFFTKCNVDFWFVDLILILYALYPSCVDRRIVAGNLSPV